MTEKQPLREFLADEMKKWAVRVVFLAVASGWVFVLTPLKDRASAIWLVPEQIAGIKAKLDELTLEVQCATGEDRVIWEARRPDFHRSTHAARAMAPVLK